MSSIKSNKSVTAREIIDRVMERTGLSQKEIASQLFETPEKSLSNKIGRGTIDYYALLEWAGNEKVDLNWLFTGVGRSVETEINDILLWNIIEAIEEGLAKLKRKSDPKRKAGIIALLYEIYSKSGEKVDKEQIFAHLRLVA